jgi:hypothetical protein
MCNSCIGKHNTHGPIGRSQVPKALFIASLYMHVTDSVPGTLYIPPTHNGGTPVNTILETLETVKLGEFVKYENMEMMPLIAESNSNYKYELLDDVLNAGSVRITEVSEGGTVPELSFLNESDDPVFLMDGEELVGAKQNRVLNLSIMVPARESIVIPVSCVEAGRWSYSSGEFQSGSKAQYASARASKSRSVSNNMSMFQEARSDQEEVWAELSSKSARMEASSETSAMSKIYETRQTELNQFAEHLKPVENQVGVIFLINGSVAGLDLFDKSETLAKLMPKLVESYALDALDTHPRRQNLPSQAASDAALQFLEVIKFASMEIFPSVGIGQDYRPSNGIVAGGGLVVGGTLVHLGVFPGIGESSEEPRGRNALIARDSYHRRLR